MGSTQGLMTAIAVSDEARAEIVENYIAALAERGSPLLNDPVVAPQLRAQINAVLDVVARGAPVDPWGRIGRDTATGQAAGLGPRIGVHRASAGIRPTESQVAAGLIFHSALPVLARELAAGGHREPELSAALSLNWAITWRMSQAGGAYIDFLLARIHQAQFEERRRIARDLHDRAAHAVGVGAQYLELCRYEYQADEKLAARLGEVRGLLVEAVDTIRALCADLRDPLDAQGMEDAVRSYLAVNCPPEVAASLTVEGEIDVLSPAYAQELYLALREAMRNVFLHARSPTLRIRLSGSDARILGEVDDTGVGFDLDWVGAAENQDRVGLTSMRERIELLGGLVEITSAPGAGTSVRMMVPVAEGAW